MAFRDKPSTVSASTAMAVMIDAEHLHAMHDALDEYRFSFQVASRGYRVTNEALTLVAMAIEIKRTLLGNGNGRT